MSLTSPMHVNAGAAFEARYCVTSEQEEAIEQARSRFLVAMDGGDLSEELDSEEFLALVKAGDANAIGRHVLAAMSAWAYRLARREVEA